MKVVVFASYDPAREFRYQGDNQAFVTLSQAVNNATSAAQNIEELRLAIKLMDQLELISIPFIEDIPGRGRVAGRCLAVGGGRMLLQDAEWNLLWRLFEVMVKAAPTAAARQLVYTADYRQELEAKQAELAKEEPPLG